MGIKGQAVRGQGRGEISQGKMEITFIVDLNGIGKLIFMEIGVNGKAAKSWWQQTPEGGRVKKGRAENTVGTGQLKFTTLDLSREAGRRQTHTPFPFAGR